MSFWNNLFAFNQTTEANILAFNTKVWNEVKILPQEIETVVSWIANTALPDVTAAVEEIMPFASLIGTATGHPELAASMSALDTAMKTVNTLVANAQASKSVTADQAVQAVAAVKAASAAAQQVVAVASSIVATTAPTTVVAVKKS
jgi:hypothetical protein